MTLHQDKISENLICVTIASFNFNLHCVEHKKDSLQII